MRLLDRFSILRKGGVIDRQTHEQLQKVLVRLEEFWQLPIDDKNGANFMIYLALMLMRFKRNEVSAPMTSSVLEELKQDQESFKQASRIVSDVEKLLGVHIPESEVHYLVANLYAILNEGIGGLV